MDCKSGAGAAITAEPFDAANLRQVVDVVKPLWTAPGWSDGFRRLYAEFIVRNNIFDNGLSVQITEDGEFLSAAFAARKDDRSSAGLWLSELSPGVGAEERESLGMAARYLELMDGKTHSLMGECDIRLSLFVSRKSGSGKIALDELVKTLRRSGYRDMLLWTDCDCNWEWYPRHGFSLVAEEAYRPFSERGEKYMTYIFRKSLQPEGSSSSGRF